MNGIRSLQETENWQEMRVRGRNRRRSHLLDWGILIAVLYVCTDVVHLFLCTYVSRNDINNTSSSLEGESPSSPLGKTPSQLANALALSPRTIEDQSNDHEGKPDDQGNATEKAEGSLAVPLPMEEEVALSFVFWGCWEIMKCGLACFLAFPYVLFFPAHWDWNQTEETIIWWRSSHSETTKETQVRVFAFCKFIRIT